jgi:carotenoid phi-ring synthase / carotenoid chi-ring synthase
MKPGVPYPGARDHRARVVTDVSSTRPWRANIDQHLRATVVGGGLAGAAAAMVLAERGIVVDLHEAGAQLGGRVSSWPDQLNTAAGATPMQMERGFHAFFRQYYNVRMLMKRWDPQLSSLRSLDDYPLYGPNGAVESFKGLPSRPPFNLMELVRRTPTLSFNDLRAIDGEQAAEMLAFDGDDTYARFDSMSAAEYLDSVKFPPDARRMLFEVFAHSFFNPEDHMSAAEMLMMFHVYFLGTREGICFDVLERPFQQGFWEPAHDSLLALGARVRTQSPVVSVEPVSERHGVVLALSVGGLRQVVAANPWMGDATWRGAVDELTTAPPFVVHRVWFDGDVQPDRAPFAGTAGFGIIDNISCVHRYQDEARLWALQHHGSVVETHAYAVPESYGRPVDAERIRIDLLQQLHACYPETHGLNILDERLIVRDDCPAFAPGSWQRRPTVRTPTVGLALAGDLVRLPFPTALMERAVTSGMLAANELLDNWGLAPEPVWSIPTTGVLTKLQRWQRSGGSTVARHTQRRLSISAGQIER